jgi:hypothetical protein
MVFIPHLCETFSFELDQLALWAWTLAQWDLAPWLSVVAHGDTLTTVD